MQPVLAAAAAAEALTGLCLLALPSVMVRLLFGAEVAGAGIIACRVAGIALLALGVACGPPGAGRTALAGMFGYNLLATIYFAWIAIDGQLVGVLLWPAVVAHASMTLLLGVSLQTRGRRPGGSASASTSRPT